MKKTTFDFYTGLTAGTADVIVNHPLWSIKTLNQSGYNPNALIKIITKNPFLLYTGVGVNIFSNLPLTAIRVGVSSLLEKTTYSYSSDHSKPPTFFSSFLAGGISSLFGSPIEFMLTLKLKNATYKAKGIHTNLNTEGNFYHVSKHIISEYGFKTVFKGIQTVAIRDAIYTVGFITAAPYLKSITLNEGNDSMLNSNIVTYGLLGFAFSFLNHPFDTIKTTQHSLKSDSLLINGATDGKFLDSCKKIVAEHGIKGFYSGWLPRSISYGLAFIVKATVIEKMNDYYDAHYLDNCGKETNLLGDSTEND